MRVSASFYSNAVVDDVRTLVELHLRFHGYGARCSDAAVRRYVRDAGALLDRLNQLTRADCTTRNAARADRLGQLQDELEERIARLAEEENLEAMRPPIDGGQVMEHLGTPPGPLIGEALAYLFELRMERGPIPEEEAFTLLDGWAREHGGRDVGSIVGRRHGLSGPQAGPTGCLGRVPIGKRGTNLDVVRLAAA